MSIRTLIHDRVAQAQSGENPTVICRMPSGWVVLGDAQFIPGYCLLLPDPVVLDLNTLDGSERVQFLSDMAQIGDALLEVTESYRINYEILGNTDAALHVHIFPRYLNEPDEYRKSPVFRYPSEQRSSRPFDLERDQELMHKLADAIRKRDRT